ncbi:hypothetical protein ACFQRC_04930 [Enterovirga sp. GCM10030262]|uniref:hypothetical protein n=1 Tax=Enterovirga sp. GCM10030262 TaxID=3273391 RepID=UPI00361B4290
MTAPRQFVAAVSVPERRRLSLTHTGVDRSSYGSFEWLGWELVIERLSNTGQDFAEWDVWEETMLQILRYEEDYAEEPVVWRALDTNREVDLRLLQPTYDASMRFATALKTAVAPNGDKRLCFNRYDDGRYRFTLEERLRDADLEAWVPKDWSSEHSHLEAAERAARRRFDWLE